MTIRGSHSRAARGRAGLGVAAAAVALLAVAPASAASESGLPGMCNGRSDAGLVVHAQAHDPTKYILNLTSDGAGVPTGVLILGRGGPETRLYVDEFCRVWRHLPDQPGGGACAADLPDGAVVVHAVGIAHRPDGTSLLVRTDAKQADSDPEFRVRYREFGSHDHVADVAVHDEGDGCSDEGWTRFPEEGWAPLHQLRLLRVAG